MNPKKIRTLVFAVLMSAITSTLVSSCILFAHGASGVEIFQKLRKSLLLAWPIVFISILTIAPLINKILDFVFKANNEVNN